jgi:5'-3' exonuclease
MTTAQRLVLVDGSASVYRAFHALPPLSNSHGIPTNAVLGFTTILLKLLREEEPQALAIAFDGPGPTTRHRDFAAYKANRPAMPDSLAAQIPFIHRVVDAMAVPRLMISGEEADDILGTVAVRAAAQAHEVRVVTADKDLLQLVGERIVVRDPLTGRITGPVEVEGRYGIAPGLVPDLLALMGDSSDNIPGIPGVGEKTARDLLRRFGSLEATLARAAEVERPKLREALVAHADQARLSKRLATIRTDLDVPWGVMELRRRAPDAAALLAIFRELEFTRLVQQFEQPGLGGMSIVQ